MLIENCIYITNLNSNISFVLIVNTSFVKKINYKEYMYFFVFFALFTKLLRFFLKYFQTQNIVLDKKLQA